MGATLFALLAGRPPFPGDSPLVVMAKHRTEPAARPQGARPGGQRRRRPRSSPRRWPRRPSRRYADAGEMLLRPGAAAPGRADRARRPPPAPRRATPATSSPSTGAGTSKRRPGQLWPLVSNTERFNRAIGLLGRPVRGRARPGRAARSGRAGSARRASSSPGASTPSSGSRGGGWAWSASSTAGPFEWFVSVVELAPEVGRRDDPDRTRSGSSPGGWSAGRSRRSRSAPGAGRRSTGSTAGSTPTLTGKLGRDPVDRPVRGPRAALRRAPAAAGTLARRARRAGVRPDRGRAARRLPRAGPAAGGRADPAAGPGPAARARPRRGGRRLPPGRGRRASWSCSGTSSARSAGSPRR